MLELARSSLGNVDHRAISGQHPIYLWQCLLKHFQACLILRQCNAMRCRLWLLRPHQRMIRPTNIHCHPSTGFAIPCAFQQRDIMPHALKILMRWAWACLPGSCGNYHAACIVMQHATCSQLADKVALLYARLPLTVVADQHVAALTAQLLKAEHVDDVSTWCPVITCLAMEAASALSPTAMSAFGVRDPRFYIKVLRPIKPACHASQAHSYVAPWQQLISYIHLFCMPTLYTLQ